MDANEPKKYIRTLAGDTEILKKGGMPDLMPLDESSSVAPAPPASTSAEAEETSLPNLGPIPEFQVNKPSFPKPAVSIPKAEPPPPPPPPPLPPPLPPEPEPSPPPKEVGGPTPLETYASDFSDRMKETRASPMTVLAAEQDAAATVSRPALPKHPHSGFVYVCAGVLLLIAGGWGIYAAYTNNSDELPSAILETAVSAPIFVEEREKVSGTGATLAQAIGQSVSRALARDTVRLLYAEEATTADTSIFSALQLPAPNVLLRNLAAADSIAGVISVGGKQSPFFILAVESYSETFSGMLLWEKTMLTDVDMLFPAYPVAIRTTTATTTLPPANSGLQSASTTASVPVPSVPAGFRDEVISNHDARVYRDSSGRSVLVYGYWNRQTLVIARDPAAFKELLNRLASARARR